MIWLVYAAILVLGFPVSAAIRLITVVWNLTIVAAYALLIYADSFRRRLLLGVIRDWFPLAVMLLAYREMGWLARPHPDTHLEDMWLGWDRAFLYGMHVKAAIEALGPVLPSILEIAYSLVYAIAPFSIAIFYVYRRRESIDAFLTTFALAVLAAYGLLPYFPSEPPRTVFPGQDFPAYETVFRSFNRWLLGGYGIHTSVFPSAHVAGGFSAAFAMIRELPEKPWVGRFLLAMAVLIALATVYGRYHYLADAGAGLALAVAAAIACRKQGNG